MKAELKNLGERLELKDKQIKKTDTVQTLQLNERGKWTKRTPTKPEVRPGLTLSDIP